MVSRDSMESPNSLQAALVTELESLYTDLQQLTRSSTLPESQLQLLRGLVSVSQFAVQQTAQQQTSGGFLTAETEALRTEVESLKVANTAYSKQLQWLKDRIALSRTTVGTIRLKATLKQTLDAAVEITQAQTGSIFLLNDQQVVTESILARQTTHEERHNLLGQVLEKGLAGWVVKNRAVAIIPNARQDYRWINLPDQPYEVKSALCAPILLDDQVLGILTLTHPDIDYFTQQDCDLMMAISYQMALVLENSRLHAVNKDLSERLQHSQEFFRHLLKTPIVGAFLMQNNKFVHVNDKLAELFDYPRKELINLTSIASLLAYEDRDMVAEAFKQCLSGQVALLNLTFRISQRQGQVIKVMTQGVTTEYHGQLALVGMMAAVE